MELHEKSREELWEMAKKLDLKPAKNVKTEALAEEIELATIKRQARIDQEVREKLKADYKLKQDIAEVQAAAELAHVSITIPDNPTLVDLARLRQELGIKKKIRRPFPETIAIEKSKKVYAIFHNQEARDEDVHPNVGNYHFDLWPERIHVLPEWVIHAWRKHAVIPVYGMIERPGAKEGEFIKYPGKTGSLTRFLFEILGDAPDDAEFGVVTNKVILEKLKQPA